MDLLFAKVTDCKIMSKWLHDFHFHSILTAFGLCLSTHRPIQVEKYFPVAYVDGAKRHNFCSGL